MILLSAAEDVYRPSGQRDHRLKVTLALGSLVQVEALFGGWRTAHQTQTGTAHG